MPNLQRKGARKMKTTEHCTGCRNNFYNGNNSLGVARCWSLAKAKLVTKFRIGTWVPMNIKEAYLKVRVPDCYHCDGSAHLKAIPHYAQTKAQRDAEKARDEVRKNAALSSAML
jgi:hypothetical protein